ncbi:hypothetical protein [Litoreibacter roseus]|uniref:Uncharacterized protein n=1 Tax=Litoreibacter roseus TaxID=2601869 RepID=A0A6N6JB30_9RHOB|nr:hypothetical protein [Litoreibacter roseus]GFE63443.1 hypothetical protein KIN_05170 [Litoreibacter roseus]
MKQLLISAALVALAAPAFAQDSPAENYGTQLLPPGGSVGDVGQAADILSSEGTEERIIVPSDPEMTTLGSDSIGHRQLAEELGVSPDDYTPEELGKMYIDRYD